MTLLSSPFVIMASGVTCRDREAITLMWPGLRSPALAPPDQEFRAVLFEPLNAF
jgi:hypothetical protein